MGTIRKKPRRKPKSDIKHYIYSIRLEGKIIYWGITSNPTKRQYQHNQQLRKGYDKQLYNYLRMKEINDIELIVEKEVENKITAIRYECLQILLGYFNGGDLQQSVPRISTI